MIPLPDLVHEWQFCIQQYVDHWLDINRIHVIWPLYCASLDGSAPFDNAWHNAEQIGYINPKCTNLLDCCYIYIYLFKLKCQFRCSFINCVAVWMIQQQIKWQLLWVNDCLVKHWLKLSLHMRKVTDPWWRHQMETFSALLAICAGNSPVTGEFPTPRPVTRSFDVFFDLRLNERLSKQSWGWWFEMPKRPLWRHRNVTDCRCSEMSILWIGWVGSFINCVAVRMGLLPDTQNCAMNAGNTFPAIAD